MKKTLFPLFVILVTSILLAACGPLDLGGGAGGGGSDCSHENQDGDTLYCDDLGGADSGSYTTAGPIDTFVIKAGTEDIVYSQGSNNTSSPLASCWNVNVSGNTVTWTRLETSRTCKDPSHFEF